MNMRHDRGQETDKKLVNFRNVLLCLAIGLQFLTYMKHVDVTVLGIPAPVPSFDSSLESDKQAPADRAGSAANPVSAAGDSILPVSAERSQRASGAPRKSSQESVREPTLQSAAPRGSAVGAGGKPPSSAGTTSAGAGNSESAPSGDPAVTNPGTTDSAPETTGAGDPEPPDSGDPESPPAGDDAESPDSEDPPIIQ